MKNLIFLLLAILAAAWFVGLSACKKDKWPSGRVLEFGTDKPISGATVTLNECEGEILGSFNCFGVATTKADADGAFDFKKQDGFAVSAEAQGYWPSGDDFVVLPQADGGYPPVDVHLFPNAWLRVTIRNTSGAEVFYPPSNSSGNPGLKLLQNEELTFPIEFVRGNIEYAYVYGVIQKDGELGTTIVQKPFCIGHDTTQLTINY